MYKIIDLKDDSFKIEKTIDDVMKTIEKEWGKDENTKFLRKFLKIANIGGHFLTENWCVEKIDDPNPTQIHQNIQFFLDDKKLSFDELTIALNNCDPESIITLDDIKNNELHFETIKPGIYY